MSEEIARQEAERRYAMGGVTHVNRPYVESFVAGAEWQSARPVSAEWCPVCKRGSDPVQSAPLCMPATGVVLHSEPRPENHRGGCG